MKRRVITVSAIIISFLLIAETIVLMRYLDEPDIGYYIVSEKYTKDAHVGVVCDGDYLYDYNFDTGEKENKRLSTLSTDLPALSIRNIETDTHITKVGDDPATYECTFDAISWYVNTLLANGYSYDSYESDSEHYDCTMTSKYGTARIVWNNGGYCYIFYEDDRKNTTAPPYIIG